MLIRYLSWSGSSEGILSDEILGYFGNNFPWFLSHYQLNLMQSSFFTKSFTLIGPDLNVYQVLVELEISSFGEATGISVSDFTRNVIGPSCP